MISLCVAKYVGCELLKFIFSKNTDISFVVTCKGDAYEEKIYRLCLSNGVKCHRELDINSDKFVNLNKENSIELVFMLWFPTIVQQKSLDSVKTGFINLHPSYIPWNRGMHPYYWSIAENTVAGTTIHFIDKKIDEGFIVFQREVEIFITDTGETLYNRLLLETMDLFKENYDNMIDGNYTLKKVDNNGGSFHYAKHIESHSCIDLNKKYVAKDLIDIIRARTFKNGKNAFFYHNFKKYNIKLFIEEVIE